MPGLSDHFSNLRSAQPIDLGNSINKFVDECLLDFTHLTVLMYLVRNTKAPCSPAQIAEETGDPRKLINEVLDHFKKHGLVRSSSGFLTRKFALDRDGGKMELVSRLVKLWEHHQAHEAILRRVLAPKSRSL